MLTEPRQTAFTTDDAEPADRSMLVLQYVTAFIAVLAALLLAVLN